MFHIKELREQKGINMREAAQQLDMPYTTYVNYEKGLREPTSEVLILLANFYETSVDYLVGRTDISSIPSDIRKFHIRSASEQELSTEEQELIRKYRCLDNRGKSSVLNILEHEYNLLPGDKDNSLPKQA